MMNYIGADGFFINLAAIVTVEDVSEGDVSKAAIVTTAGVEIMLVGSDADNLFERISLIALETEAARQKMQIIIHQAQQGAQ